MESLEAFVFVSLTLVLSILINFLLSKFWKFPFLKSQVKSDRWGKKPVPLTGGIAIFIVFSAALAIKWGELWPTHPKISIALAAGVLMFILGLVDDVRELKSHQKFFFQIVIILLLIGFGVKATLFGKPLSYIITFLWLLGITNAFNLLDNMDGLSSGIAVIASLFLGINFLMEGFFLLGFFSLVFAAAVLGFLLFNFPPAKIYLGDSGALFIGYTLGAITILGSQRSGKSLFVTILFPILIMLIPIFDTVFVTINRRIRGQSPFKGSKDHLSHHLVLLGFKDKQAVLFLYSVSFILAISSFVFLNTSPVYSMIVYFFVGLACILFGTYIGKIKIVKHGEKVNDFAVINPSFMYKKRILFILVDLALLIIVYYISYVIRFEGSVARSDMHNFVSSFPIIVFFKILFIYLYKVDQIESRFFSFSDGLKVLKSVSLGSISTVLFLTFIARFQGYSRAVFVIDWMLSIIVLVGVKVFFRLFDEFFFSFRTAKNKKIILIGEKRTYRSIDKYLQLRSELNMSLIKYFPSAEFKFEHLLTYLNNVKHDIAYVLLENAADLNTEEQREIHQRKTKVVNENEFFSEILR